MKATRINDIRAERPWDIVVIGGGAAGSSAALVLARGGCRVIVLEASRYDAFRIGETLPPSSNRLLARLSIMDSIKDAGHLPSPGTVSLWGSDSPYENDFVFSPYATGWHLDRVRFDAMLAQAAADAGAMVLQGCTVASASFQGRWSVVAAQGDRHIELNADYLIDAAGRGAWRGRASGPRTVRDRLVAIVLISERSRAATSVDERTLIESCADGWWYSSLIPGRRLIGAFFTDSDLIGAAGLDARWRLALAQSPRTAVRMRDGELRRVQLFPANSTFVCSPAGAHWIAVGDAICTFDPLSSQGLSYALTCGIEAADLQLGRSREVITWTEHAHENFASYWRARQYYYQQENRWPGSPFWRRRHAVSAPFLS